MDQLRHVKGVDISADNGASGMSIEGLKKFGSLNGPAWLQTDGRKCQSRQIIEAEAEQATSAVATETKLEQLIEWRQYRSFNRFGNFIAYCMRFRTKQKRHLKAEEIYLAEQILFRFVQNERFQVVSKSIKNSNKISKTLNIAKLSPFI